MDSLEGRDKITKIAMSQKDVGRLREARERPGPCVLVCVEQFKRNPHPPSRLRGLSKKGWAFPVGRLLGE